MQDAETVGRPPKKDRSLVKLKVLPPVRINDEEDALIRAGAEVAGKPLTTWVREVVLEAARRIIGRSRRKGTS